MKEHNEDHAKSGLKIKLPSIETFPNQFPGYTIRIEYPRVHSGLPQERSARFRDHPPGI